MLELCILIPLPVVSHKDHLQDSRWQSVLLPEASTRCLSKEESWWRHVTILRHDRHVTYLVECFQVLLRRLCIPHLLGILLYKWKFKYPIISGCLMILPKSYIFIPFYSIFVQSISERGVLKFLTLFRDLFLIYFKQFLLHLFCNYANRGLHI